MISSLSLRPEPDSNAVQQKPASVIGMEQQWRCPDGGDVDAQQQGKILVSRWTCNVAGPLKVANPGSVALNLKCTSLTFSYAGNTLIRGQLGAGMVQISAANVPRSAVFESPSDVLHLFVSEHMLAECFEDRFGRPHVGEIRLDGPKPSRDPALEHLGQALAVSQSDDAALGKVFTDSVSLAIVSRVVARHFPVGRRQPREARALPSWRLSRAVEYVDAHLSESIGLEDIARSAGLTRMHFASQFRRATGLRPHEYLLRRRIEHAQRLLLESRYNVLDVALSCGFRTQAHFATVFKRFVGQTPCCWRKNTNADR
jgi:AraC-like DNA-binding protein